VLSRALLPVAVFAGLIAVVAEPLTKLAGRLLLAEPLTRLLAWLVADLVLGIVLLRLITATIGMEQAGVGRFWPSSTVRSGGAWWTWVPWSRSWPGLAWRWRPTPPARRWPQPVPSLPTSLRVCCWGWRLPPRWSWRAPRSCCFAVGFWAV
jgi:hypothetical protein